MDARISGLYVIIDPDACRCRPPIEVARLALEGGASIIQWRDKRRDKGEQLADLRALRDLCARNDALLVVNDHADLALAIRADGVHLGQRDLPPELARPMLPEGAVIGVSTNNVEEALRAEANGASYVAVGSAFPTGSKGDTRPASPQRLAEVKAAVRLPVVAIGGIDEGNIEQALAAGADAIAVISAVCAADDIREAARRLAERIAAWGERSS